MKINGVLKNINENNLVIVFFIHKFDSERLNEKNFDVRRIN
jgi:hypothetical protein